MNSLPRPQTANAAELLGRFAAAMVDGEIPAVVRERAELAVLDTLGVALAGVPEPGPSAARSLVTPLQAAPWASVWGTPLKATPAQAAWVNGIAAHALDYNAYDLRAFGHPTAILAPVAIALGEWRGASGAEVVRAYVAGYETTTVVGVALGQQQYDAGFHTTGTIGTLGAVVAASVMLRLDAEQATRAIGIATSLAPVSLRCNFGTDTKPLHVGEAAAAGIRAAELSAAGFTASMNAIDAPFGFVTTLGGDPDRLAEELDSLGSTWRLETTAPALKLYASCAGTHSAITAAIGLRGTTRLEEVDTIVVHASANTVSVLTQHEPVTGLAGKFSMEYCVSAALVDGQAGAAQFTDDAVNRPTIQALMKKIRLEHDPRYDAIIASRQGVPARIELFAGHAVESAEVVNASGTPENRATVEEVIGKFESCASIALDPSAVEDVKQASLQLWTQEEIRTLTEPLSHLRNRSQSNPRAA